MHRAPRRPARTVFFGSGPFAVPILEALLAAPEVHLVAVVSVPDRPAGRGREAAGTPVARRARERGLTLLQPSVLGSGEALGSIGALEPDLGVLADYGRLVPPALIDLPPRGILNVHPSLLPRHRGAAPVSATILAGDARAGVTLIKLDAGLDTGPIVAAEAWPLSGSETGPELEGRAAAAGAALLARSLRGWLDGTLLPSPQPAAGATLTRPLRREDGRLDPTRPAAELARRIRALQPWPGSFVETSAGRLVVWRAAVAAADRGAPAATVAAPVPGAAADRGAPAARPPSGPGGLVALGGGIALVTSEGLLVLEEVQLAGRRRVAAEEFVRGHPGLVGESVR